MMNKTDEVKKLKAEIKALTRKLYRKVIAYHRACDMQLIKDKTLGIQMYSTATFGITHDKDGTYRKTCTITIKDKNGGYPDLLCETEFNRNDWNPNKEDNYDRI